VKKLIAFSSVLALVVASSGLFAFDILDKEGESTGFSVSSTAQFGFDIKTEEESDGDPTPASIYQINSDPQAKVEIGVGYDGDNYAFGLAGRLKKNFVDSGSTIVELDDAWGKYYLMDKQLWLQAGTLGRVWGIDTDPLNNSWAEKKGFQLNFTPKAVSGLSVGFSLPVPKAGSRLIYTTEGRGDHFDDHGVYTKGDYQVWWGNWGPAYLFTNMAFGLRLNGTIPNLDFGMELGLNGQESSNGKLFTAPDDEAEGEFKGMKFHFTAVYTFAPVTIKAALLATDIASGVENNRPDTKLSIGGQISFAIPEVAPNLSLGEPWVRLVMEPTDITSNIAVYGVYHGESGRNGVRPGLEPLEQESLQDMHISFEWEPSYSIVPDKVKALLWFGVYYSSWVKPTKDEEDYPMEIAFQPKVEFTFAPSATLSIFDKVTVAQKRMEHGFKNEIGFRFAWAF
jgi:hypothetical protein